MFMFIKNTDNVIDTYDKIVLIEKFLKLFNDIALYTKFDKCIFFIMRQYDPIRSDPVHM